MPENAQLIREAYDAFARQDIPALLETFDLEIDFNPPDVIPNASRCRGHDETVAFFASLGETYDELRVEPEEYLEDGDRVVVLGTSRGSANGKDFETPFVHVWTVRDGKAVHMKEYLDPRQMIEAVGWQAPASVTAG
jgi:uncharacterized protein